MLFMCLKTNKSPIIMEIVKLPLGYNLAVGNEAGLGS